MANKKENKQEKYDDDDNDEKQDKPKRGKLLGDPVAYLEY
jgi:hypothetical protein